HPVALYSFVASQDLNLRLVAAATALIQAELHPGSKALVYPLWVGNSSPLDGRGARWDRNRRGPGRIPWHVALLRSANPVHRRSGLAGVRAGSSAAAAPTLHRRPACLPAPPPSSRPLPGQPLWAARAANFPKTLCLDRSPFPPSADSGFRRRSD